jgi:tetratricopeptide (TPR) repeat protein
VHPAFRLARLACTAAAAVITPWMITGGASGLYLAVMPRTIGERLGDSEYLLYYALLLGAGAGGTWLALTALGALWGRGRALVSALAWPLHWYALILLWLGMVGSVGGGIVVLPMMLAPRLFSHQFRTSELVFRQVGRPDEAVLARLGGNSAPVESAEATRAYLAGRYAETAGLYRAAHAARFREALARPRRTGQPAPDFAALVYAQLMAEDLASAELGAQAAMAAQPAWSLPQYIQGHVHARRGRWGEAAGAFERAWRLDRHTNGAAVSWAVALFRSGELPQAVVAFNRALSRDSHRVGLADFLGFLEALEILDRAVRADPANTSQAVLLTLALRYLVIYDPSQAERTEAAAEAVLKIAPEHPEALITLGVLARKRGRLPEAEGFLRRAVAVNRTNPYVWLGLHDTLRSLGREPEALQASREAKALDPAEPLFRQHEAASLLRLKRYAEIPPLLDEALHLEPRNVELWLLLGQARLGMQQRPEAIAAYREGLRVNPASWQLAFNAGYWLLQAGQTPEAIQHYEVAARVGAGDPAVYLTLGRLFRQGGRLSDSARALEQGTRRFPQHADLHLSLCHTYQQMSRTAEADQACTRGRTLARGKGARG